MLDILYYLFIFPLESIMKIILDSIFFLTNSYGVSIIILSILINLFLLKLTNLTKSKADKIEALTKEINAKLKEFKRVFKGSELNAYTKTLYKQKHFHPIFTLSSLGGLALQVPFFITAWFLFENNADFKSFLWIDSLLKPDSLLFGINVLPILMTIFTLVNVFISSNDLKARIQGSIIAFIFLALLYNMPSALLLYWTTNTLFALIVSIYNNKFKTNNAQQDKPNKEYKSIINLSLINICFLICIYSPFSLYVSDMSQFEFSIGIFSVASLIGFFILSSIVLIYINSFIKNYLKPLAIFYNSILIIGLVYSFILVGNYGIMHAWVLQDHIPLIDPDLRLKKYLILFIVVSLAFIFSYIFFKYLKNILYICLIALFIPSVIYAFNIISYSYQKNEEYKQVESSKEVPLEKELFSYSKTNKNIVIIVLDMFDGSHTEHIFNQFPYLKDGLDGFVLFPNTVSTGNATASSVAALISGEYYSAYSMNTRKFDINNEIDKAFYTMSDNFIKEGYFVSYLNSMLTEVRQNENLFSHNSEWTFSPFYIEQENINLDAQNHLLLKGQIYNFLAYGLFKFTPDIKRKYIYKDGIWLNNKSVFNTKGIIKANGSSYAFTHIINTESNKPTFKYLHSNATHAPYKIYFKDNECIYFSDKTAFNDYPHNKSYNLERDPQQYDTEACNIKNLNEYVKLLKENGIYDNTQIFVISDHSHGNPIDGDSRIPFFSNVHALFLFKDFNAKGALKIDNRLMTNYDSPSIFCENLKNGCPNIPKNILKNYPQNRSVVHVDTHFDTKKVKGKWEFYNMYKIEKEVNNFDNWTDIKDEVINNNFHIPTDITK